MATYAAVLAIWPKRPEPCDCAGACCCMGGCAAVEAARCCCGGAAGRAGAATGREGAEREGPAPPRERGISCFEVVGLLLVKVRRRVVLWVELS